MVQFSDPEDYKHALFQGPWMLADHYLLVQRWRPFFITNASVESRVAVWVRIPELPLELYNDKFLWSVGARLGTLLKIDHLTSIHSRGQFARICVEIDLSKKLVPSILVRGIVLKLEYEGLHIVCFACGKYGHKQDRCPELQLPTAVVEAGQGGGAKEVECKKGNSLSQPIEKTQHGLQADGSLPEETVKQGHRSCEKICENDRYHWLTVKKVNRQQVANKAKRLGDRGQSSKGFTSSKEAPILTLGSRFSRLTEGTKLVGVGKSNISEEAVANASSKESPVVESSNGPKNVEMGPEGKAPANKIRNRKGGKNPQGHLKGKEKQTPPKFLGPRAKLFSTKVARTPLGHVEGVGHGKKAGQMKWSKPPLLGSGAMSGQEDNNKGTLNTDFSLSGGKINGGNVESSFPTAEKKDIERRLQVGEDIMEWNRVEDLGDSDVLRDLHLGIQNFMPKIDPGGDASVAATNSLLKDEMGGYEGVQEGGINVSKGSVSTHSLDSVL